MKVAIFLEKYSDWLEAFSIFVHFKDIEEVTLAYLENARNNTKAVNGMFEAYKEKIPFKYISCSDRPELYKTLYFVSNNLDGGDLLAAPFIRYRDIWKTVPELSKRGVKTLHLSESLPDSFGRLGYRLGFRLVGGFNLKNFIKQICLMPIMNLYALKHMPDLCFYNMYPYVKNPFVKQTLKAYIPQISNSKIVMLKEICGEEKRPLLISGFGYDLEKMVNSLNVDKYIATSKDKEIIIDGKHIPLDDFICAEEVMLAGCVNKIIGYNSTAICWAMLIGDIEIECYESKALSRQYGFLNGYLTRKTMKKCGVELLPERKDMVK